MTAISSRCLWWKMDWARGIRWSGRPDSRQLPYRLYVRPYQSHEGGGEGRCGPARIHHVGPIDIVSNGTGQMSKRYGIVYVDLDDDGNGTGNRSKKGFPLRGINR